MNSFAAYFAMDTNLSQSTPHSVMVEMTVPNRTMPKRLTVDVTENITPAQLGQIIATMVETMQSENRQEKTPLAI